jgi:hypothetical protein
MPKVQTDNLPLPELSDSKYSSFMATIVEIEKLAFDLPDPGANAPGFTLTPAPQAHHTKIRKPLSLNIGKVD